MYREKPVVQCFNSSAAAFTGSGLTSDPKDLFFKSCTLSTTGHWIGVIRRKRKKSESLGKKKTFDVGVLCLVRTGRTICAHECRPVL